MNKKLRFVIIFLVSLQSFSQIKGTITNAKDSTLAFVNIYIEGTFIGTTSNDDGKYELNVSEKNHIPLSLNI